MIVFALACGLMLLLAMVLLARPLLRRNADDSAARRVPVFVLACVSVTALAGGIYLSTTTWPWQGGLATNVEPAAQQDTSVMLAQLQTRTAAEPQNIEAWLDLGSAYVSAGNYALAGNAYQQAYDLSKGQNIDAITGLAEALVLTDQTSMNGRVGVLIDEALQLQPQHPKALWYGGLVALQMQNLPLARDRFKALLALNPSQQVRTLLERQIQDLSEQLGETTPANAGAPAAGAAAQDSNQVAARKVTVKVTLAANIKQQLQLPISLFVLARNPAQPGAPLAVERHQSTELPLQVELTKEDAMLPTRTLGDAQEVEIVARLSASGMPTEQAGDYYGSVRYSFAKQGEQGTVSIEINQRVP